MLLNELVDIKGSYVGVTPAKESKNKIKQLIKQLKVDNPIARDKMHCTVIYSRKPISDFTAKGTLDPAIKAIPKSLKIFQTQEGKNALVLELDCEELHYRHQSIMKEYGATYDYPEYIPHITLSYDCKDFDVSSISKEDLCNIIDCIEIDNEYYEDLKLDWKSD